MPFVSIIISSYNYGRFLKDAIDSALNQTYGNTEVIVVDDGSTDNSRAIMASFGNRIKPVLKENGGQASAFNSGFSVSKGDIIIFLDSDDRLCPNAVEEVVRVWHTGISKVHYRLQWMDAEGNRLNTFIPPAGYALAFGDLKPIILKQGIYRTPPTSGNAYSREFLREVLPVPEENWRLCPDAFLHAQVAFYGKIGAIEKTLGYYRVHGSNASSLIKFKSDTERLEEEINFRNRCEALILRSAERVHLNAGFNPTIKVAKKITLFMICPENNLVKDERLSRLIKSGIHAVWKECEISILKKIVISGFFILLPFFPRNLAKEMLFWYIYPEKRPLFIRRMV